MGTSEFFQKLGPFERDELHKWRRFQIGQCELRLRQTLSGRIHLGWVEVTGVDNAKQTIWRAFDEVCNAATETAVVVRVNLSLMPEDHRTDILEVAGFYGFDGEQTNLVRSIA